MLALVAPFVSQCWSADALFTCAVPIYVMWAAECSSFVGAWLNCLWLRVLCVTCAIILVVQLISPLAGDQVCLLAPVVLFTPVGKLVVHLTYVEACHCMPHSSWSMAQDTQLEVYVYTSHAYWRWPHVHVEVDRPMHTSVGGTDPIGPHPTLPGDDIQPIRSPAGVGGGVHAEQAETRPR